MGCESCVQITNFQKSLRPLQGKECFLAHRLFISGEDLLLAR